MNDAFGQQCEALRAFNQRCEQFWLSLFETCLLHQRRDCGDLT